MVFRDKNGSIVDVIKVQWLRDYTSRDISYDCEYFLKDTLTTSELEKYRIVLLSFIEDMELDYPVFPFDDLMALKFNDAETTHRFQLTLAKVQAMAEEKGKYSCMENDIEILSELLQAEEEMHPSWADEATVKFWEFSEALERGVYMVSKEREIWIEIELYEFITKFIDTLEGGIRKGYIASWLH